MKIQTLARLTWYSLMITSLTVFIWAVPARYSQLLTDPFGMEPGLTALGFSLQQFAMYGTLLDVLVSTACWIFGMLLFLKRPNDRLVWLMSLAIGMIMIFIIPVTSVLPEINPAWTTPILVLRAIGFSSLSAALLLFPDGRFVPHWTRWVLIGGVGYSILWVFFPDIAPIIALDLRVRPNTLSIIILFSSIISLVIAQVYRYRYISTPTQRQQTRWVVMGLAGEVAILVVVGLLGLFREPVRTSIEVFTLYMLVGIPVVLFSILLFPLTVAIAIMRHHLWDIDALIRRTLVYSLLTSLLAVIYFSSVALLQSVLNSGSSQPSPLVIVVTTLLIYILFNPLRLRLQFAIDRRFYRQKYDAEKALAEFAATARTETDLAILANCLTSTIQETMQPSRSILWLEKTSSSMVINKE